MTEHSLLQPKIPHGIRVESAWKIRSPRAHARVIPYPSRTRTRSRLRGWSDRPPLYNQLEPREKTASVHIVKNAHTNDDHGRLIARIIRTLLASEHFDSLADLTEALKCHCARLRIRWTNDDITAAYRLIASNTPLPGALPRRVRHVEREPDVTISRHEAAAMLHQLGIVL